MSAPANGEATLAVNASAPDTAPGDGVAVSMDLTTLSSESRRKRAVATDCSLAVVLDGQTVYNSTIFANDNSTTGITSSSVPVSDSPLLEVVQTCGDDPVQIIVSDVLLVAMPASDITSSSLVTQSVPVTGSVTNTATSSSLASLPISSQSVPSLSVPSSTLPMISSSSLSFLSLSSSQAITEPTISTTGRTSSEGTITSNSLPSQTSSVSGFPSVVGDFAFLGCVGSSNNFPTFNLQASNQQMDIEQCTALCADQKFAGIYQRYVLYRSPISKTLN